MASALLFLFLGASSYVHTVASVQSAHADIPTALGASALAHSESAFPLLNTWT